MGTRPLRHTVVAVRKCVLRYKMAGAGSLQNLGVATRAGQRKLTYKRATPMDNTANREWILNRRPVGFIADGDLVLRTSPIPSPKEGEVLVRTTYLSLDPTNR